MVARWCAWLPGGCAWWRGVACMAVGGGPCVVGRGHAWLPGAWLTGGMCGWGHAWLWGACVVAGGHAWLGGMHGWEGMCGCGGGMGGMHGWGVCVARGACMVKGGMCGEGVHVWQKGGMCGEGGMHGKGGHAWQTGACVAKRGHPPPYEIWPVNARSVRIILECILVLCRSAIEIHRMFFIDRLNLKLNLI